MKQLTILGSTGSIGCSTLDVVRHNPEHFRVVALVAGQNVTRMVEQCLEFSPRYAVMDDEASAKLLKTMLQQQGSRTEVLSGQQAACDMAALEDVDQVMAAIVGAAGLLPTLAAIRAGKTILLANKESLVTCGRLFMDAVKQSKAQLLPVDSEHNAIFQSLPQPIQHNLGYADLEQNGVVSILLTGSGGPFRETPLRDLATMTPDQACRHPNWSMGAKITIDSASMMNKGFEVIEAHWLFGTPAERISVLLHPQSIIHSMVEFEDGAIKAQLGTPDMRLPISFALLYPDRANRPGERFNFLNHPQLTFAEVDRAKYPALDIAYDCLRRGGTAACTMNGANEVAVAAFLARKCAWLDIVRAIRYALEHAAFVPSPTLADYAEANAEARALAAEFLQLKN